VRTGGGCMSMRHGDAARRRPAHLPRTLTKAGARARAGFVRLAVQQRAALVPVLAMGELDTLRNLIDMPRLQARSPLGCRALVVVGPAGASAARRRARLQARVSHMGQTGVRCGLAHAPWEAARA